MTENHHNLTDVYTKRAYSDRARFHYLYQNISHYLLPAMLIHTTSKNISLNIKHASFQSNHHSSEMSHCTFVQCFSLHFSIKLEGTITHLQSQSSLEESSSAAVKGRPDKQPQAVSLYFEMLAGIKYIQLSTHMLSPKAMASTK